MFLRDSGRFRVIRSSFSISPRNCDSFWDSSSILVKRCRVGVVGGACGITTASSPPSKENQQRDNSENDQRQGDGELI
jgi:hypothetical protein